MIELTIKDRFELQDLYSRYAHAIDANDGRTWSMCYTHDGLFAATTGRIAGKVYRGREELELLGSDPNREPKTRHWNCNYYFIPHEDHIEGRCYVMRIEVEGDAPVIAASAVYHDVIVREDGQWRFKSRRPQLDLQRKLSQV